jgi:hypothetical protein
MDKLEDGTLRDVRRKLGFLIVELSELAYDDDEGAYLALAREHRRIVALALAREIAGRRRKGAIAELGRRLERLDELIQF